MLWCDPPAPSAVARWQADRGPSVTPTQLSALLVELLSLPNETEWVEWKHNNDNPEMIAERLSALANSAALHGRDFGYMVWG